MANLITEVKTLPSAVKNNQYTGNQALIIGLAIAIVIITALVVFGNPEVLNH